ncbi:hypothetical protein ACFLQ5_00635 [Bacteroidota bacterium]
MKTYSFNLLMATFFVVSLFSCKNESSTNEIDNNKSVITERIQYDVFIKSPYPNDTDWWKENIEGIKREAFVKKIMEAAYKGKVQAYTYWDNEAISGEKLQELINPKDTIELISSENPYEMIDTIVDNKLDFNQITKIRFLEEWYINEKTMEITKKVVGICPVVPNYDTEGEFRGNKPLFWLYLDDKYPIK